MLDIPGASAPSLSLSSREKAAVIVRLLLAEGALPELGRLREEEQAELVLQLGRMGPVDRATVDAVVAEFVDSIANIGVSFPDGLDEALGMLDGVISPTASSRVRRLSSDSFRGDPWEQIAAVDDDRLAPALMAESTEIAAVVLSKLPVARAAALLGEIPGDRARRITYAISLTTSVAPETVRRIGVSLAEALDARPPRAFSDGPVTRVGAILNQSRSAVRDEVLSGLDDEDGAFAEQVRKAIFTFANIKDRVAARDVPRIQREISQEDLVIAVAACEGEDAAAVEFLLSNISQRLSEQIRGEAGERPKPPLDEAERAMSAIVTAIRALERDGEIFLVAEEG